jgi:eukaryotic-like serine/threonine-protein kinase
MPKVHVRLPERYSSDMEVLGRGGFGVVYKTTDRVRGMPVAVKVPFRGSDEDLAREVTTELKAAACLRHPGIVQVLDSGTDLDGYPFLVMEYAGEGSLAKLVERGPPPWQDLLPLLQAILDAIGHAHSRGLIHRDIKDQNILLARATGGGLQPKLADFGLAKVIQRRGDYRSTRMAAGTLLYMAPETFAGDLASVHPTVDLYAFGVLLYLLIGRDPPWEAEQLALVTAKTAGPHQPLVLRHGYDAPAGLGSIVDRLLARRPGDRYELAADVRADLATISAPGGGAPPPRPARSSGRSTGGEDVSWISRFAAVLPSEPASAAPAELFPATPAVAVVREPELVDRADERAWLWERARGAAHQSSAVVLLGTPGIGRSKLCRWLSESLETAGLARTLHVRLNGGLGAGHAATAAVRRFLGLGRLQGARLTERLTGWLRARSATVDDEVQALADWLDPSSGSSRSDGGLDRPIARQAALVETLLRLEAARGLVCLRFEEEAPTPGGLELALEVFRRSRAHDLPLLLLYEPLVGDDGQGWPDGFEPLEVGVLEDAEVRELLRDLAPGGVVAEDVVATVRGRPGRAVASARLLAEQARARLELARDPVAPADALRPVEQRTQAELELAFSATATVPKLGLARLYAFIGQGEERSGRELTVVLLSLLPRPSTRATLEAAWLAAVGSGEERAKHFAAARQAGVVVVDADGGLDLEGAAIGQAAVELRAARPDLKLLRRSCASALLGRGDALGARDQLAASKLLLEAGDPDRALDVAQEAAEHLLGRDAAAALAAWDQAAEAVAALGSDDRDTRRIAVAVGRARAARAAGDLDQASAALEGLDPDGLPADDRAPLLEVLASVVVLRGDPEEAGRIAERAGIAWAELDDVAGQARARLLVAAARVRKGEAAQAIPEFESARDLARQASARLDEAHATWRLAWARRATGDLAGARADFDQALALARDLGAAGVEAIVLRELGNLAILRGQHDEARELLGEATGLLEARGFQAETAVTRISLGELARATGDLRGARREYAAALGLTRAYGATGETLVALLNLGITELGMEKISSAARRLSEVDRLLEPGAAHRLRPYVEALRLAVQAGHRNWDGAEEALEELAGQPSGLAADQDLLTLVEHAADSAAAGGEEALAFDAWDLAVDLARRLHDDDALERLKGKLGAL